MQKEAESHASEDIKRKEEVEAKNSADNMAYTAEKTLRENKEKVSEEIGKDIEEKVAAVRETLKGSDVESIKKSTEELNGSLQKLSAAVAASQQQPSEEQAPPTEGEGGEAPPSDKDEEEGTVEGEFREV